MQAEQGQNILKCKCKAEWRGDSQCEGIEPLHICPLLLVQSAQKWELGGERRRCWVKRDIPGTLPKNEIRQKSQVLELDICLMARSTFQIKDTRMI